MPKENINSIPNFTPDTDDEYSVFIDGTILNSDTPFIYRGANDDPESYSNCESDTTCSPYDTSFMGLPQHNTDDHTMTDNSHPPT